MKNGLKLFLTVLSVLLIALSVAIVAGADNSQVPDLTGAPDGAYYAYVNSSGDTVFVTDEQSIQSAINGAVEGSTLYVLRDATVTLIPPFSSGKTSYVANESKRISISKGLTIDLRGNTLALCQRYKNCSFSVSTEKEVRFKNGVMTGGYDGLGSSSHSVGKSYSLIAISAKTNIVLENVDTYLGQMFFNYSSAGAKVTVIGGEHHLAHQQTDCSGGFIESRNNLTFVANDATFYCTNGAGLISSMHYKGTSNTSLKLASTYTFNNCTVMGNNPSTNLIIYSNEFTDIYFNNCSIYGSITPKRNGWDVSSTSNGIVIGEPRPGSVHFTDGTALSEGSTYSEAVAIEEGMGLVSYDKTIDKTLKISTGYVGDGSFKIVEKAVACKYSYIIRDVTDARFVYYDNVGNKLYGIGNASIFATSDSDRTTSPVTLVKDVTISLYETETVNGELNIDLNGYTLTLIQYNGAHVKIDTDAKVSVYGGKIVTACVSGGNSEIDTNVPESTPLVPIGGKVPVTNHDGSTSAYPLFVAARDGVNILIEDVTSYVSSLVYSEYDGTRVTLNGGEHHTLYSAKLGDAALVSGNGEIDAAFNSTKVYVGNDNVLVSSDGTLNALISDSKVVKSDAKENIIGKINENTKITVKTSLIYGSVAPEGTASGAIVLCDGTLIGKGATLTEGVVSAEDGYTVNNASLSREITFFFSEGFAANGDFKIGNGKVEYYAFGFKVDKIQKATVTVNWYREDGKTLIRTDEVMPGTVLTPPEYTPESGVGNGWYTTDSYDGWAKSVGGSKVLDFEVSEATDFYPAYNGEVAEKLTVGMYNLTFYGSVGVHFYLPYDVPEGIVVNGVYSVYGDKIEGIGKRIEGKTYTEYTVGKLGAANLTEKIYIRVSYSVGEKELNKVLTLTPSEYVKTILEDSKKVDTGTNVYPETVHTLIADLTRYSNTLNKAILGVGNGTLISILDEYGQLCSPLPSPTEFTMHTTSALPLADYVSYITFAISNDQPRYVIGMKSGAEVVDVTFSMQGFLEENTTKNENFGKITYALGSTSTRSGELVSVAVSEDIPVYNLDRDVTITLTLKSGATVSGTYSLNEYYSGMSETGSKRDDYREFLRALRAFARTGSTYKYPAGELVEGAKCEFWDCEHETLSAFHYESGRYCSDCATHIFFYKDFGAVGDGKTNDYGAVYAAHTRANTYVASNPDARVGVVAGKGRAGSTFWFGISTGAAIAINTDTDWSGVTFIFDDRVIPQKSGPDQQPVFKLSSSNPSVSYIKQMTSLKAGADNIGFAPGKAMLIYIMNTDIKHYFRYGANASNGQPRQEVILVDEFGNIDPSTPVEWDYERLTTAAAYSAYDKPITVSGLDEFGEISCNIITMPNHDVLTPGYVSTNRGISVSRSNVRIGGIYHELREIHALYYDADNPEHVSYNDDLIAQGYNVRPMSEIYSDGEYLRRTAYTGVSLSKANGVVIFDMSVENHIGRNDDVGTALGSYEFSGGTSSNVAYVRCRTRNLYSEVGSNIGSMAYRGMFGTNYMRNMYFKDCYLNSMDAHSGAYNATIEDSTFEHMNFIGGGDIIIKNTIAYVDGANGVVRLRSDYGSSWHGNLYIDGLEIRHHVNCSNSKVSILHGGYTNHNFGPDGYTYMPTNVYINDVKVTKYVYDKGGVIESSVEPSDKSVYFYYNMYSKKASSVTTRSVSADGTVTGNNYVPPTKVVVTNSDVTWLWSKYSATDPYILQNMKVYVDNELITIK